MDVIYHRNCLDGVFSSFIAYLLGRVGEATQIDDFLEELKAFAMEGIHDLTQQQPHKKMQPKQNQENQAKQMKQDFYHQPMNISVNAYSFFAGQYYALKFPGKAKILLVLDTNLASAQNIHNACKTHQIVIMIDHHTSFKDIKQDVISLKLQNFFFIFDESHCASQLCFSFLDRFFSLSQKLSTPFLKNLQIQLTFVSANDTKKNETRQSKSFILGFYYFGIELSHTNPNLYKRVGMLDLEYTLGRGANLYVSHVKEIRDQVKKSKICQFNFNGKFKGKKCLFVEPSNAYKISDIGTVMACISAKNGLQNLAFLCIKGNTEIRCSCRSYRGLKDPKALELSQHFGGGGHTQAAGFKLMPNQLKSQFKISSATGINLNLSQEQVQTILLNRIE